MKLRMRHNSIRLRLTQSEVTRLIETGEVAERIVFAPDPIAVLHYRLRLVPDASGVNASINENGIMITLPDAVARQWADTEQVGIEAQQHAGSEAPLLILVEKDFRCVTAPPHEDQSDAFPHPVPEAAC